ncbi:unnamed protein product [Rhizophagus irregularis]|nr:unnamed protein product [Rhizophagus irregularis]
MAEILVIEHEMSRKGYDLPRTVNNRPGYDMDCKNEITETEKEFDKLSIVKPRQTLTSWAINMRIPLQELWAKKKKLNVYHRFCLFAGSGEGTMVNSAYYRPRIYKSHMAICFYCWKLIKININ